MNNASEKQVAFINSLLTDRETERAAGIQNLLNQGDMTSREASDIISHLLAAPKKAVEQAQQGKTPTFRYAIERDGVVKFYRVQKPVAGRWAGYTFVHVQASDELWPVKNPAERKAILAEIEKNPEEAMVRYGRELGQCGHCGRTLTDEASRAAGIGPICADKMGF